MQAVKFRNIKYLSLSKVIGSICFLLLLSLDSFSQAEKMNNPEHDSKPYYFGISVGLNASQYKVEHSQFFTDSNLITNITPIWKPGFHLGICGNLRVSNFIDLRAIPSFVLKDQAMNFNFGKDSVLKSSFESVLFSLPVEFKFKSDRQTNFRFYAVAGGKIDYDFNANSRSKRPDEILRVKPFDFGYNLGLGFEFYFPNFILAPEMKISNGLGNTLAGDAEEFTTKVMDRITSRMLIFSLIIQG